MGPYNIAVVGATGNVGRAMLDIIYESSLPIGRVEAIASKRSAGKKVSFGEDNLCVHDIEKFNWQDIDIAFFSAGSQVSSVYAGIAAESAVVIDNTSYFRMNKDVPLIIPEVNILDVACFKERNIIANPNCAVIQLLVALKPLHDIFGLKRIVVTTMQSVSGAGRNAMDELYVQTKASFLGDKTSVNALPARIAFNMVPQIGNFDVDGYTTEELKIESEVKKILNINCQVNATCVRVPVFVGHSESVSVEFETEVDIRYAYQALENAKGVLLVGSIEDGHDRYIMPIDCPGDDYVYVSRLRMDRDNPHCLNMWIVSDNLRKGAALNAVQIAEQLIANNML